MRVLKEETIGLIIDIQERLFPHIYEIEDISSNTQILIKGLNALEIPIIVTQQYTKALGETVKPVKEALGDFNAVEKITFSCCDEPSFLSKLDGFHTKNVIVAGIEAHVCVTQTVIDLMSAGYKAIVVTDCISSRKKNDKKIALKRMQFEGAILTTYEAILFELCRIAKTDTFKHISKLVK